MENNKSENLLLKKTAEELKETAKVTAEELKTTALDASENLKNVARHVSEDIASAARMASYEIYKNNNIQIKAEDDMSNKKFEEFESKLQIINKLITLGWSLLVGAFCLGIWVATLELRTENFTKNLDILSSSSKLVTLQIQDFQIWKAQTEANRWTSQQAASSITPIYDAINGHDKRLQRLEDAQVAITKSLDRIEVRLGTSK